MIEIIIGSKNVNKIKEIKPFFIDQNVLINNLPENFNYEVIEDGKTLLENANKKALSYAKNLNKIVLSDDTGLFIKSINNEPGINSHRYSNQGDLQNNLLVLEKLKHKKNRKAYFKTVISLAFPDGKIFNYQAIFKGFIINNEKELTGFGYDPIFIPRGETKTIKELGESYKLKYSHRSKALLKLIKNLEKIKKYYYKVYLK